MGSNEIPAFSWDVGVLFSKYHLSSAFGPLDEPWEKARAYNQLPFAREVSLTDPDEGVVLLTSTQSGTMDISREETNGRKNATVKSCLKKNEIAMQVEDQRTRKAWLELERKSRPTNN